VQIENEQRKITTPVENRLMGILSIGFGFQFWSPKRKTVFFKDVSIDIEWKRIRIMQRTIKIETDKIRCYSYCVSFLNHDV